MRTAIKHSGELTDYDFITKVAKNSGITEKEWKSFEDEVLSLEDADILPAKLLEVK